MPQATKTKKRPAPKAKRPTATNGRTAIPKGRTRNNVVASVGILRDNKFSRFVRLSLRKGSGKPVEEAKRVTALLLQAGIPYWSSPRTHEHYGCALDKVGKPECGQAGHGDSSVREVVQPATLDTLAKKGWHVEARGKLHDIHVLREWATA